MLAFSGIMLKKRLISSDKSPFYNYYSILVSTPHKGKFIIMISPDKDALIQDFKDGDFVEVSCYAEGFEWKNTVTDEVHYFNNFYANAVRDLESEEISELEDSFEEVAYSLQKEPESANWSPPLYDDNGNYIFAHNA